MEGDEKTLVHEWNRKHVEFDKRLQEMEDRGMGGSYAFTALIMAGPEPTEEEAAFWDNWKEDMKNQP